MAQATDSIHAQQHYMNLFLTQLYAIIVQQRFLNVILEMSVRRKSGSRRDYNVQDARRVNSHGVPSVNCPLSRCLNGIPNKLDCFLSHLPCLLLHVEDYLDKVRVSKCAVCAAYIPKKILQK